MLEYFYEIIDERVSTMKTTKPVASNIAYFNFNSMLRYISAEHKIDPFDYYDKGKALASWNNDFKQACEKLHSKSFDQLTSELGYLQTYLAPEHRPLMPPSDYDLIPYCNYKDFIVDTILEISGSSRELHSVHWPSVLTKCEELWQSDITKRLIKEFGSECMTISVE